MTKLPLILNVVFKCTGNSTLFHYSCRSVCILVIIWSSCRLSQHGKSTARHKPQGPGLYLNCSFSPILKSLFSAFHCFFFFPALLGSLLLNSFFSSNVSLFCYSCFRELQDHSKTSFPLFFDFYSGLLVFVGGGLSLSII